MGRIGPLFDQHCALGAKFGEFGGWSMPLEYAGGGVLAEHDAVRNHVGVFDVSHMGAFALRGPAARDVLNGVLTNDLQRIGPHGAQYSLLCNSRGGVVDDLLVYVRSDEDLFVVANAGNAELVMATIGPIVEASQVSLTDLSRDTAIIAVQGPNSAAVMGDLGLPAGHDYLTFVDVATVFGQVTVARTGYTGEHGYEALVPVENAARFWSMAAEACRSRGGAPCGLGARDTLRTEMGYPLYGHELSADISPVEAGLSWAIGWDKPTFIGRDPLVRQRTLGPDRRSRGLRCVDRAVPRPGMAVRTEAGQPPGVVTSGTFSPTLRLGIALAMLSSQVQLGDIVEIDVRGRPRRAEVVPVPFVNANPRV